MILTMISIDNAHCFVCAKQRHRHRHNKISTSRFPLFLARAHQVMGSSKDAFSLLHTRNVSKNLYSFEKVSFGKFRSTMKLALFRESAPIAPIFFWGSGRSGPGRGWGHVLPKAAGAHPLLRSRLRCEGVLPRAEPVSGRMGQAWPSGKWSDLHGGSRRRLKAGKEIRWADSVH